MNDWKKLVRMLWFVHRTKNDPLTLSIGRDVGLLDWYVDTSFAIHPDYRGHTGLAMQFEDGKGSPIQKSSKQKINMGSSTTCELVSADDALPVILWTPLFIKDQGYEIKENRLHQDNTSTILLEKNGKRSSGEQTRALNIQYFLITDHIKKGDLTVKWCPTDKMLGDYYTKPVQGTKFKEFRKQIMGMS